MTLVLRKISASKLWEAWRLKGAPLPVPSSVLAEFMPPQLEKGRLSVYLSADRDEARLIAAAHCMMTGSLKHCVFSTTTVDALYSQGIKVEAQLGETMVPKIDALHRNLVLEDQDALASAAELFRAGGDFSFEAKALRHAVVELTAAGICDFAPIAASGSEIATKIWRAAASLVGGKELTVGPASIDAQTASPTAA